MMMTDLLPLLRSLMLLAIAVYGLAAGYMYVAQRGYQYFPGHQGLPAKAVGLAGVADLKLATKDGETLQTWYSPAKPGRATILYFHGNGGEIADRSDRFAAYQAQGFGVFFLSYRGYGASSGAPSEQGLITDATTAYDWLIAHEVSPRKIVLVGESLGSGVAVQLAAEREVAALALEAPFSSAANVAAVQYWWLPVRLLMKDTFDSSAFIGKIHAPLLILHGDQDGVIPHSEGERLFALANEPKQLMIIAGGTHDSIFSSDSWTREMEFFDRYRGQ